MTPFTALEVALLSFVLRTTGEVTSDQRPIERRFPMGELKTATGADEKIEACKKDDAFTDSEIDFTTLEKALLLKCATREWSVVNGKIWNTVEPKLA